jgi:chemotaxis family two-component system response regulator Rcp1
MRISTVLHVEDEDGAAFLFRRAVREAGFSALVFRVSNGEEALAFLRRSGLYVDAERPHLMVLDLNLPKMVVISTSSRPADKEKALSLGARHYIVKPDNFEELTQQVKTACTDFLAT